MAQPELINNLQRTRPPFNVNNFAMAGAVAALEDRDFIKHSLQLAHSGRDQIQAALTELGLDFYPSQANFICMETQRNAKAMYDAISAQGITIRPLTSFGLPTSIRVSIGTVQQNQLFIAALKNALATAKIIALWRAAWTRGRSGFGRGTTFTAAKLVCRLPWALNGLGRTSRWTPASARR